MIVSDRRLAANQRNAALSTGPRTVKGKMVSRNNALRHGLARPVTANPVVAKEGRGACKRFGGFKQRFLVSRARA